MTLYEDGALDVVCTALRSSPSHAGVQFSGAGTWLHVRQYVCEWVVVFVCVFGVHTSKFLMPELLLVQDGNTYDYINTHTSGTLNSRAPCTSSVQGTTGDKQVM